MNYNCVFVDDDISMLALYESYCEHIPEIDAAFIEDPRELISFVDAHASNLICAFVDLHMPHYSALDLLPLIAAKHPELPLIVITAEEEISLIIQCIKSGAFDYILKDSLKLERLRGVFRHLSTIRRLSRQVEDLSSKLNDEEPLPDPAFKEIITTNKRMIRMFHYLNSIAEYSESLLINGETGTGKEMVAKSIHEVRETEGPFVAVNMAGLDEHTLNDTLFGHKKGAFTGAGDNREGLVAKAQNGTLFLDEIGDCSHTIQAKLLRMLQEKEFYPLGSDRVRKMDAFVVAATNRDLEELVEEGTFRRDLFYRLSAHTVTIPPLRERKEDLPLLIQAFVERFSEQMRKQVPSDITPLLALLNTYGFPGNVRELENIVKDQTARLQGGQFSQSDLNSLKNRISAAKPYAGAYEEMLQRVDLLPGLKEGAELLVEEALRRSHGNQAQAARMLGITRQALNKRLQKVTT
ncbi:MAG: sigma-54 dependent transcriptional regulator [Spirochaetales bacterium]|nr:sigma-54 dependent transcriptional regulator [Spirochaetales bacterium]